MTKGNTRVGLGTAFKLATLIGCFVQPALAVPLPSLSTTIPALVADRVAKPIGAPSADTVLHLAISLPLRNMAALDGVLAAIYDPKSPHFRHYLSVAQFTRSFGPTEADYKAASSFFAGSGLTVERLAANRMLIDVAGRIADIERVFHVSMGLYRHPLENRVFMSPDRVPTLDLKMPIQAVIGLDDFVRPVPKLMHGSAGRDTGPGGSGPDGNFTGNDMRKAYYPRGSLTGAGQSIGLMELASYSQADVDVFFNSGYGPRNSVNVVGVATDSLPVFCTAKCSDGEQTLDISYAISIAPGLDSVRVYVGSVPEDVLNAMATDNISKVLSTSWGWRKTFDTDDAIFKEFAAQGQTNLAASGDDSSLKASGPWPEEDANIVGVGGTDVVTRKPGGRWAAETGWEDSAGGPSLDKAIKIPSYQKPFVTAANGASSTLRNVPDISANANFDMILCQRGHCSTGWGGTSFASPMVAGIVALANQQAEAAGKPPMGFINPAIYALAGGAHYGAFFHDETSGTSGDFSCTPSFDLVTGLGSPRGQRFIDGLVNYGG